MTPDEPRCRPATKEEMVEREAELLELEKSFFGNIQYRYCKDSKRIERRQRYGTEWHEVSGYFLSRMNSGELIHVIKVLKEAV